MARLAILLAGAVLALAGCGTDREPTAARTATPTPVATAGRTQPVIAEPPAGATITADTQEDDRYRVAVDVRGVAEPDERVVVSTGCQDEGCRKAVFAAGDGAFAATVEPHRRRRAAARHDHRRLRGLRRVRGHRPRDRDRRHAGRRRPTQGNAEPGAVGRRPAHAMWS